MELNRESVGCLCFNDHRDLKYYIEILLYQDLINIEGIMIL